MDKSGWKVFAVILLILLILSWGLFVFLAKIGIDEMEKENTCSNKICAGYDSFYFDGITCYCYKNNEVALTKEVK